MPKIEIIDKLDVDFYGWANTTVGTVHAWNEIATDYANIYSHGDLELSYTTNNASLTGRKAGGEWFELYAETPTPYQAGVTSWVRSDVVWKSLVHYRMKMSFKFPNTTLVGPDYLFPANWAFFGIDFYYGGNSVTGAGNWSNGLYAMITPMAYGYQSVTDIYAKYNVTWYNNGEIVATSDPIYCFLNLDTMEEMFWVDIWVSRMNGSSYVAGRVSSYEYGLRNKSGFWQTFFFGGDWAILVGNQTQSMCFAEMQTLNNETLYSSEIELTKIWSRVEITSTDYDPTSADLLNFDVFQREFSQYRGEGIMTPAFIETKAPAYTGPSGIFRELGTSLANFFIQYLYPALAGVYTALMLAADEFVYGLTGYHIVQTLNDAMVGIVGWVTISLTYSLAQITNFFNYATGTAGNMITTFTNMLTWNPIMTYVVYPFFDALAIASAWLSGTTYTNRWGQTWDWSALASIQVGGISGGAAIFVLLLPCILAMQLYLCVIRMSPEPLIAPIRIVWAFLKGILFIFRFVFNIFYKVIMFFVKIARG
jgi:hypothetical protein